MFDRTLLERLEAATDGAIPIREHASISLYQDGVLANIRRVLNARQGCCETRPDYGMPDLNDMISRGADSIAGIARAVQEQIEMFEPRLTNVAVRFVPDPDKPLQFSFHISAVLYFGDDRERISFDTILSADKHVQVKG